MPPGKKRKASESQSHIVDEGIEKTNQKYNAQLSDRVSEVLALPEFKDFRSKATTGTTPFNQKEYETAMGANSKPSYTCDGNASWINEIFSPLASVPINSTLVDTLAGANYKQHDQIMEPVSFSIASLGPKWNPMEHKGGLKLASPLEPLHALWAAAHRDCCAEAATKATRLGWGKLILNCRCTFVICATDLEIFYYQENQREAQITLGKVLSASGLQKVMKTVSFKRKVEHAGGQTLTPLQLHELMSASITVSPFSEPVTETFVKEAIAVYEQAFSNAEVLNVVTECEGV